MKSGPGAFLRFSRDRRGYEHFYLIQPANRRNKLPRLLYWFRTPPNVKIGRQPFDPGLRRVLELQNPDVNFDWTAIVETPIPPVVDTERWRERRRVDRAIKQSATEPEDRPEDREESVETPPSLPLAEKLLPVAEDESAVVAVGERALIAPVEPVTGPVGGSGSPLAVPDSRTPGRGRRRRRRGRRQKTNQVPGPEPAASESPDVQESGEPADDEP